MSVAPSSCSPFTTTCTPGLHSNDPCQAAAPVFLSYQEALMGFIQKRVLNQADAEDLTQQVLLKVHKHCETLPQVKNVKAWLYEITRNVVNDFHRTRQRETYLPEEADMAMPPAEQSPLQELERCVLPLLQLLPAEYAEPLRLSDLEGVPQQEVATRLGLSLSGAKSRIQRGRDKLKTIFLECCEVELDRHGKLISADIKPDCEALKAC